MITHIPAQLTKGKLILHDIDTLMKINVKMDEFGLSSFFGGCHNYTKILMNHASNQNLATGILPFFQSILHLLLSLSKILFSDALKLLRAIVMSVILVHKNSSEVIKKLRLRKLQGSYVSSLDYSTSYTSLPRARMKAEVLFLLTYDSQKC